MLKFQNSAPGGFCFVGVKGGANAAPELAEVGSVIKREGFAVGAAAADAARGPGGGAIVLVDGMWRLGPQARGTAKSAKHCDFQ